MRVSDIISLGTHYLKVGAAVVLVLGVLFTVGYLLIYKKLYKGTRKIPWLRAGFYGVFTCYLIDVLGATMFSRGDFW